MLLIGATVLGLAILYLLFIDIIKPKKYPPGPVWLPIVGSYLSLRRRLASYSYHHLVWESFADEYGPVVGLRLGRDLVVVVSGYSAVRDVLAREEFDGRPDGFFFRLRAFGQRLGIVFTDGFVWSEQRRFTQKHLRHTGLEKQIAAEAEELVTCLQRKGENGKPVPLHNAFDIGVLNSLWAMLAGCRFKLNDERLGTLLELVHRSFRLLDMSGGLLNQMPFLRFLAPSMSGYNEILNTLTETWQFIDETIQEHKRTLMAECSRDMIDSFILEMKTQNNPIYTEKQLLLLCLDLFMAGSETTSNTLSFALMYMILYPDVQRKVQNELDRVVGRKRFPTLQDKQRLPYIDAVIMEVQRKVSVAPVAVPHRATKSTTLMGHRIPKNTTILLSIWSVHMDANYWGDPETFRPERFMDYSGNIIQYDQFIPFGYGKRRCLGEALARKSLFIFFATLLHKFSFSIKSDKLLSANDTFDGVTLSPKPFYAHVTKRV